VTSAPAGRPAPLHLAVAGRNGLRFAANYHPGQVADQLERLRDATEAGELIITAITHDHAELLAEGWARR
jgi:alkanesulfonate monooxygenase SsuD/methylene tetrahydromethanopterin reductase-like flavin-dependent oxidoreductase (luciferase family)